MSNQIITDFLGREIFPGNIIAWNRGSGDLKTRIVYDYDLENRKLYYLIKKRNRIYARGQKSTSYWSYRKYRRGKLKGYSDWYLTIKDVYLDKNPQQGTFVLIDDPLFNINSAGVAEQLETADFAKEEGLLPKEYNLGEKLSDEFLMHIRENNLYSKAKINEYKKGLSKSLDKKAKDLKEKFEELTS